VLLCAALLSPITVAAPATEDTPFSTLARLASYLSENDASSALGLFDSQMKGFGDLAGNVEALAAQTDVTCAIDVVSDVESGGVHKLDLDWIVNLTSKADKGLTERRRERVQAEMRQIKGRWKITSLSPLRILDAIHIR
jgi:hypothetical protein